MEKLSKENEQKVIAAIESAIKLANAGSTPNEALRKVAEDNSFTPPLVRRMVEAFNVSKTLAHMKHASGEDRVNSFPLADAGEILKEMYPENPVAPADEKAAEFEPSFYRYPERHNYMKEAATEVTLPPLVDKKAEAYGPDPVVVARTRADRLQGLSKRADNRRSVYRQKIWELNSLVKEGGAYFRQLYHTPFAEVERNMVGEYGAMGKTLMDMIYKEGRLKESRYAEDAPVRQWLFDSKAEPYTHLTMALKVASDSVKLVKEAARAQLEHEKFARECGYPLPVDDEEEGEVKEALLDEVLHEHHTPFEENALAPASEVAEDPFEKDAVLPGLPETALASGAMSILGLKETDEKDRQQALSEALDPVHESKLRSISTQAMLSDFMSNDPIISSYSQDDVVNAYNQLAQLAPSVSQQPAVARGMLRRLLQSESIVEPHEAGQLTDVETKLRKGTPGIAEVPPRV